MKISENKIRDIIMEELDNLTSMPLVAYASKELSNKAYRTDTVKIYCWEL